MKRLVRLVLVLLSLYSVSVVAQETAKRDLLETAVTLPSLDSKTLGEALRIVQEHSSDFVLFGLELPTSSVPQPVITIRSGNYKLRTLLDWIMDQAPDFQYRTLDASLINVYPKDLSSDAHQLLDIRLARFDVSAKVDLHAILNSFPDYAPELAQYLENQRQRQNLTTLPRGHLGATMHGNMDPQVEIHLQNVTVREAVSAVCMYSLKLNKTIHYQPIGWRYISLGGELKEASEFLTPIL
jgi:hypothetical protein